MKYREKKDGEVEHSKEQDAASDLRFGMANYAGAVSADSGSPVDFVRNSSSQTTKFDSQVVPQSVPNTSGLVSTQEAEPGSAAWYARRSPDAPPPPKGWQG